MAGESPASGAGRYSITRRRLNPLRSLRFRPVSNRWASRVRLGLPARWAGLLSCRSEVTPFRIHQPEHDGPRGFGIIVHNPRKHDPRKSAPPAVPRSESSKSSSVSRRGALPAGRRVPGAGLEPARPHGGQGILSPSRLPISPSRHSTRPSSALRRPLPPRPFPGVPPRPFEPSGGTAGREPASSEDGMLGGPPGRTTRPRAPEGVRGRPSAVSGGSVGASADGGANRGTG